MIQTQLRPSSWRAWASVLGILACLGIAPVLTSCDKKPGEAIDEGIEEVQDETKDAANEIGDEIDDATSK